MNSIKTTHGDITLHVFFPDGTRGFVRTLDSIDLKNSHVQGIVQKRYRTVDTKAQLIETMFEG